MKKPLSLTISVALLMALATIFFISCKKDIKEIASKNNQDQEKSEAQQVYEKIMKFREAREAYHADAKTDNGYVSPSEARSILDGAINYEFSDVNRYLEEVELDTLRYIAPVTNNDGKVAVNDLIDIYDNFTSNIGDDTNSVNYFMINYPQSNTRNSDVEIVFTRGIIPPDPEPYPVLDYFEVDEDWIWGLGNGKCDMPCNSDAAKELTNKCNTLLSPYRTTTDTVIQETPIYDVEIIIKNHDDLQSIVNGVDNWLFHAENVQSYNVSSYCITYDYLNIYLMNLRYAVISSNGCYHYSPFFNSPIRDIKIDWKDSGERESMDIWHQAELKYYKIGDAR